MQKRTTNGVKVHAIDFSLICTIIDFNRLLLVVLYICVLNCNDVLLYINKDNIINHNLLLFINCVTTKL